MLKFIFADNTLINMVKHHHASCKGAAGQPHQNVLSVSERAVLSKSNV